MVGEEAEAEVEIPLFLEMEQTLEEVAVEEVDHLRVSLGLTFSISSSILILHVIPPTFPSQTLNYREVRKNSLPLGALSKP